MGSRDCEAGAPTVQAESRTKEDLPGKAPEAGRILGVGSCSDHLEPSVCGRNLPGQSPVPLTSRCLLEDGRPGCRPANCRLACKDVAVKWKFMGSSSCCDGSSWPSLVEFSSPLKLVLKLQVKHFFFPLVIILCLACLSRLVFVNTAYY